MRRPVSITLLLVTLVASTILAATLRDNTVPGTPTAAPPAPSSVPPLAPKAAPAPATCEGLVMSLTPRERLAQLLVVGVDPVDARDAVDVVRSQQVGGIFIGGNATGLLQDNALAQVQQASPLPVSVAIDEEGGRVQRIDELDGSVPSARVMARTMSVEQVRELGRTRGKAMSARGVTVDFAPDTDVSDQPDGSVIGDRSFADDPEVVRQYATAFAAGLEESGVQPVLKHFPGHGHADGDSHNGLVRTPPLPELRKLDLVPYERIGEYGHAGVMIGHLQVPDLTGDAPASLSPAAYQLLRKDYAFTGPIITDDLGAMRAISDRYDLPDAVLIALQSGADQALWSSGDRVAEVLDRLESAVASGKMPESQVQDSAARVLSAKKACG
ncbi:MAG: beta-N-acetylhexosaminidase [Actinomycetota bacterium]|jgi:beta-N-acetylhexosaminidase|nr:beta-N-acetylhexosaminidase [Actinomycetota bacterium]